MKQNKTKNEEVANIQQGNQLPHQLVKLSSCGHGPGRRWERW